MPSYGETLAQTPALLYGATFALGLVVGSFLNVVILRLPRIMEHEWHEECAELLAADGDDGPSQPRAAPGADRSPPSLSHPGSSCPHCGHRIRVWENIPVLSFVLLRGRCSRCGQPISWRYPLVESATALLSLVVIWQLGPTAQGASALALTWGLIALAVIDYDTQLLPDAITLPLLWLGLVLSIPGVFVHSTDAIVGAVAGYVGLWLMFHLFRLLTRKEGMGRGDFKLLALFGAWLGWQSLPQILLLSTIPGVALIATGRGRRDTPIAFGPFLAAAGWVSLLWGDAIATTYLHWSGLG
jgi:leader peptidase (prepilin peptidase)/N-methyltransferase